MKISDTLLDPLPDPGDPARIARRLAEGLEGPEGDLFCYWNRPLLDDPVLRLLEEDGRASSVRIVFPMSRTPSSVSVHTRWRQSGAQVRERDRLPPGALLLTTEGALLTTRSYGDPAWAHTDAPGVLAALRTMASRLWDRAEPVTQQDLQPTETERQILTMLMQGLTDRAISRHLETSDRTVRRTVAQLMERLDAQSRFEAGVRAVERRWI
ncbi:LuxR C-terminal-related transcriptional regulator [Streptomyces sp. NPDC029674]|uniref:helix-turn-helix transcriptional regulator n=1 Tax=Streptomyces sp. NPDC029674 TaxID=3365297 RepID=UPI00384C1987